jgi:hypothetical protein
LTLSSIFLCGIVVTYVANADNFRKQNETLRAQLDAARQSEKSAEGQLRENITKSQRLETKLSNAIASLEVDAGTLETALKNAEREKAGLEAERQNWVSITRDLTKTNEDQRQLLEKTLADVEKIEAKQIKQSKELDETTAELIAKMAIIETQEADKRRLLEEVHKLQVELDKLLRQVGKETGPVPIVTPRPDIAQPVRPIGKDIDLKGLITAVDLKHSLAEISMGSAHGVRENMTFFVTRGEKFICEILTFYVDTEKAVGDLKRVRHQPNVGDKVSTNL